MWVAVIVFVAVLVALSVRQLAGVRRRAREAFATSVREFVAHPEPATRRTRLKGYDVDLHHVADDDLRMAWQPLRPAEPDQPGAAQHATFALGPEGMAIDRRPGVEPDDALAVKLLPRVVRAGGAVRAGTLTGVDVAAGVTTVSLHAESPELLGNAILEALEPTLALHKWVQYESRSVRTHAGAGAKTSSTTDTTGPFV
ncbi:MAG: hypothetical protein JWN72_85 [Thermoleophilia bacterium]|nr:hypothetical protein [Thermoleophilia bacterium]